MEILEKVIPIHMTGLQLFGIISNVVLALQHPANIGPSSIMIKNTVGAMAQYLIDEGLILPESTIKIWQEVLGVPPMNLN